MSLFQPVPGTPLTASKVNLLAMRVAEVADMVLKVKEEILIIKDLGIQDLVDTIAKFKSKMEKLIKESQLYKNSEKAIAKLKAMGERFVSVITEMVEGIKSAQQSILDGLALKITNLTKDIKGVKITPSIVNDMNVEVTEMKLPTEEDPSYELMDVNIIPNFNFDVDVQPDLEGLMDDHDTDFVVNAIKSVMVITTTGPAPILPTVVA